MINLRFENKELELLLEVLQQNKTGYFLEVINRIEESFEKEVLTNDEEYSYESLHELMENTYTQRPMTYNEFSLEKVKEAFELNIKKESLFSEIEGLTVSDYLNETLNRAFKLFLANEKIRSEAIIFPILLELKTLNQDKFGIYSGIPLNADESKGLKGVCDFVLSKEPYSDLVEFPMFTLIEAKYNVIESALGQCAAQMIGCQLLNEQKKSPLNNIYGCVSTGELWQFMKLEDKILTIEAKRLHIDNLGKILGFFQRIIDEQM